MSDIMDYIRNEDAVAADPNGYMLDLEPWDEQKASDIARSEDIEMTPDHMQVVRFLREYYLDHGPDHHAREISHELNTAFDGRGGNRYLFKLFPNGPVRQGMRIAGLPVPADSADPAFGNVL